MPQATNIRNNLPVLLVWLATTVLLAAPTAVRAEIVINEFLASNSGQTLRDEDGDSSDWIELYNTAADAAADLGGLSVTDDAEEPQKWTFPDDGSAVVGARGYLVVFCSGKDRRGGANTSTGQQQQFHTNFKLAADGGYLGLTDRMGQKVFSFNPYPPQTPDRSYGFNRNDQLSYFSTPTPGAANGDGGDWSVVQASAEAGFYESPFSVTLSVAAGGGGAGGGAGDAAATTKTGSTTIRYTVDGSEPTGANDGVSGDGEPISIFTTTVLRAAVFGVGNNGGSTRQSEVATYTYLFLEDVIQQPREIPGFPNGVLRKVDNMQGELQVPLDMEMDPEIVADYSEEILDGMRAIPSVSIAASLDEIFGDDGFYFGYGGEIIKSSVEVLYPDGSTKSEQIYAGVTAHSNDFNKRTLRLKFRRDYGANEWKTDLLRSGGPLNNTDATDKHRHLVLRSGFQRSWARASNPDATAYTIDQFYRDSQIAMSGYGSHGTYVHLYLNGAYWGVYNLVERPDDDFAAAYFGGDNDDWFFTNHGDAGASKDRTRWEYLTNVLAWEDMTDPENYALVQEYLNVESFVDYVLLGMFQCMTDWPDNNWYVVHRLESHPEGATPADFVAWDGEWALDRHTYDLPTGACVRWTFRAPSDGVYTPHPEWQNPVEDLWQACLPNLEFRSLIAERVAVHTAPGGALSVDATVARWDALTGAIESAIIGESARWGDSLESLGPPYDVTRTRDGDWQNEVDTIRGILQTNTQQFIDALDETGFYSVQLSPPVIKPDGGVVSIGSAVTIENPNGAGSVVYTLDGSNPITPSGLSYDGPITVSDSVVVRAAVLNGDEFSVLSTATFRVPSFVVTEIHYHPASPSLEEVAAGFTESEDFAFIELQNVADRELDLSDLLLTEGIAADPPSQTVNPGQLFVLVSNLDAFTFRYGAGPNIAGTYTGSLDNGGEQIVVEYPAGIVIADFTYDDSDPWPTSPDGGGPSLEMIDVAGSPNDPMNWRASSQSGGSPGEAGEEIATSPSTSSPTDGGRATDEEGSPTKNPTDSTTADLTETPTLDPVGSPVKPPVTSPTTAIPTASPEESTTSPSKEPSGNPSPAPSGIAAENPTLAPSRTAENSEPVAVSYAAGSHGFHSASGMLAAFVLVMLLL